MNQPSGAPGLAATIVLLIVAVMSPAILANDCAAVEAAGPEPVPRPVDLPALPIIAAAPVDSGDSAAHEALEQATAGFVERAPAWSLAVAGPEVGLWHKTPGAVAGDRFHAASIGKSMTAVLVFQLIEAGQLGLETTIDAWYPALPNADLVTIDHLLTHRSGYFLQAEGPLSGPYQPPEADFERLQERGAVFCPGTGWAYSNVGYLLLGRILERVSGFEYGDLLQARILDPLGLDNTRLLVPGTPDAKQVPGHLAGAAVGEVDYATPYAAGPVTSDARDLVRYWHGLLTGELVSPTSLAHMVDPAWPMFGNAQMRYGAGLQVAEIPDGPGTMLMHSGGIAGFAATVAWLPERELFVSVLVNERQVPAEAALWALVRALDDP